MASVMVEMNHNRLRILVLSVNLASMKVKLTGWDMASVTP